VAGDRGDGVPGERGVHGGEEAEVSWGSGGAREESGRVRFAYSWEGEEGLRVREPEEKECMVKYMPTYLRPACAGA
jgi:hypothetical protein